MNQLEEEQKNQQNLLRGQQTKLLDNNQEKFNVHKNLEHNQELELPHKENGTSSKKKENFKKLSKEAFQELQILTSDFEKTYSLVKKSKRLESEVFKQFRKQDIQHAIKLQRLKKSRTLLEHESENEFESELSIIGTKRSFRHSKIIDETLLTQTEEVSIEVEHFNKEDYKLEKFLIQSFQEFPLEFQEHFLGKISETLKQDLNLQMIAIQQVISVQKEKASGFIKERRQKDLITLLGGIPQMAGIQLIFELCKENTQLIEQGNTLAQLLMPLLDQTENYDFIIEKESFIVQRCYSSLLQYIKDCQCKISKGFIIFGLKINSELLQSIIGIQQNREVLFQALLILKMNEFEAQIIASNPQKFLWNDLLSYIMKKEKTSSIEFLKILSKIKIKNNPYSKIVEFDDLLQQRRILIDSLIKVQEIKLSIQELIIVLQMLQPLETNVIIDCLREDSENWFKTAQQQLSIEKTDQILQDEKIKQIFEDHKVLFGKVSITFEQALMLSMEVQQESSIYLHDQYQAAIAGLLYSINKSFLVVEMPTSSGKTWIQILLAKFLVSKGKKVVIIVPNEELQQQTLCKAYEIDFQIKVETIEKYYQGLQKEDFVLIDEFDYILQNQTFTLHDKMLKGIWNFKKANIIGFTATFTNTLKNFSKQMISEPLVLSFKSQFELINGTNPVQTGNIETCSSKQGMITRLLKDVEKFYENMKPIILFSDQEEMETFEKFFIKNKYKYLKGISQNILSEIKKWDYGILILSKDECRGHDTKFAKDAIVLIGTQIISEAEYFQMVGRGSRTRNVCEAIYYVASEQSSLEIIQRMKTQNLQTLKNLWEINNLFSQRFNNEDLIQNVNQLMIQDKQIKSLDDLKSKMGNEKYMKLVRGIVF